MTAAGENLTDSDDEMRVAFRQMAMTFAQLEKTRLVKKLQVARGPGEPEGWTTRGNPELVQYAMDLEGRPHLARDVGGTGRARLRHGKRQVVLGYAR